MTKVTELRKEMNRNSLLMLVRRTFLRHLLDNANTKGDIFLLLKEHTRDSSHLAIFTFDELSTLCLDAMIILFKDDSF